MKWTLVFAVCAMVMVMVVRETTAAARRVPRQAYQGMGNYYYYRVPIQTYQVPVYTPQMTTAQSSPAAPVPYHKYIHCVARHFAFEACTLCYCTDIPNIGLCWDYEGEKCEKTKSLVEEQKGTVNRDPNGIW